MNRNWLRFCWLGTLCTAAPCTSNADDRLQWLGGPNRLNPVERSSPSNSPFSDIQYELAWRANLGLGYSSILVNGNRLVASYATAETDVVALLDADNGKKIWERPIGAVSSEGPLSTPAAGDGRLFAIGGEGALHAFQLADGEPLWHLDLVKGLGTKRGFIATSPLLVRDRLIVLAGGEDGNSVVAINPHDGKVLWSSQSDSIGCGSPALAVLDGVEQVVVISKKRVYSVRLSDGELLWSLQSTVDTWSTALPLGNDRVFLPMHNEHMVIECKRRNGSWNVRRVWVNHDLNGRGASFAFRRNLLFGATDSGVVCIDAENGKVSWRRQTNEGAVTLVGQEIAFINRENGQLSLAPATATQTSDWLQIKPHLGNSGWTPITSSGTDLYVRTDNLFARFRRSVATRSKNTDSSATSDGARMVRGDAELLRPGMLTIFGEMHGTKEVPAFIGKLAERVARSKLSVRVGVEIPINLQPQFDNYLRSNGTRQDVDLLTRGFFWTILDGRGSQAMVALIDKIRLLRQANLDVNIFLFDVTSSNARDRDERMAKHILADLAAFPDAVHLVLTGNRHARTSSVRYMGWHIMQGHKNSISLDLSHSGGSAWVSNRNGRGPDHFGGTDRGEQPFIERLSNTTAPDKVSMRQQRASRCRKRGSLPSEWPLNSQAAL